MVIKKEDCAFSTTQPIITTKSEIYALAEKIYRCVKSSNSEGLTVIIDEHGIKVLEDVR
jgi:hypothetical protein